MPVCFLKHLLKYFGSVNPTSYAIVETFLSVRRMRSSAQLVNLLAQREFLAQQKGTLIETLRRVHPRIGCLSLRSVKGKAPHEKRKDFFRVHKG